LKTATDIGATTGTCGGELAAATGMADAFIESLRFFSVYDRASEFMPQAPFGLLPRTGSHLALFNETPEPRSILRTIFRAIILTLWPRSRWREKLRHERNEELERASDEVKNPRRMAGAGISRFHPDPLAALAAMRKQP